MTESYEQALSATARALLGVLGTFEVVLRHLHPPELVVLRAQLEPRRAALEQALDVLAMSAPPERLSEFHERFCGGGRIVAEAAASFVAEVPADRAIVQVLASMQRYTMGLEALYAVHRFPPLARYFVEPAFHDRLERVEPPPADGMRVGLHRTGGEGERGGFCLYVPESYDGQRDLPLVVALHGGSGDGRGFMWSWLREARGRGFLLLAPTARGPTWSLMGPDIDGPPLRSMVDYVRDRWRVDDDKILLTGLSDGATYTLLTGLAENAPFTALAPYSGVLHPANLENGNLERARDRRIYLVHGALDWMFPVQTARWAHETLASAGADIVYREIEDLSHTYARDENDRVLAWFDPSLALPVA